MDQLLIDEYEKGADKLAAAIAGLSPADLTAFPVPGTWSIQQIVIHLMDSDLIGSDRMKRIIAEDNPSLIGYDESKFAKKLFYHSQSVEEAVQIFALNRKQTARILRKLPPEAYKRQGTHSERGRVRLGDEVQHYVQHLDHHLKFVYEKRGRMGKN